MEKNSHLVRYFNQEEVHLIYDSLIEYSIRNYQKREDSFQFLFREKYQYALQLKEERDISISLSDEELKNFLFESQVKYQQNLEANRDILITHYQIPLALLQVHMPDDLSDEEKIYYLVDFITKYITYSEDYFKYCVLIPPTGGIEFDFKNAIPVDRSIAGLLVEGQGLCDDIANLMVYLGHYFGVSIGKVCVHYQNRLHAINTFQVGNQLSLIDGTMCIRKKEFQDEYLLVDKQTLNKKGEYEFPDSLGETITLAKTNIRTDYNMNQIICDIRKYLQKTEVQFSEEYSKKK